MKMSLLYLLQNLSGFKPSAVYNQQRSSTYLGVRLLHKNSHALAERFIYVGRASELPSFIAKNQVCLMLVNDNSSDVGAYPTSIVEFSPDTDLLALFEEIQDLFYDNNEIIDSSVEVLYSLIKGKEMKYVADVCADTLGNPVILASNSLKKVAAVCSNSEIHDPAILDLLNNKYYFSEPIVQKFEEHRIIERVQESPLPAIIEEIGLEKNMRRLVGKIVIQDKVQGFMIVLEQERKFTRKDINIVGMMCEAISLEMKRSHQYKKFSDIIDTSYMIYLLDGKMDDLSRANEWLRLNGWGRHSNLRVISILSGQESVERLDDFRTEVEDAFRPCKTVNYNDSMVLLCNPKDNEELNKMVQALKILMENKEFFGGMSMRFTSLKGMRKGYQQSQAAHNLGRLLRIKGPLYDYSIMSIYDLLNEAAKNIDIGVFYCEELEKLLEYDAQNGTDYYATLYEYLISGLDNSATAKKLFIHRNTMLYRIDKIREIIEMDPHDGNNSFRLFLSYKTKDLMSLTH